MSRNNWLAPHIRTSSTSYRQSLSVCCFKLRPFDVSGSGGGVVEGWVSHPGRLSASGTKETLVSLADFFTPPHFPPFPSPLSEPHPNILCPCSLWL